MFRGKFTLKVTINIQLMQFCTFESFFYFMPDYYIYVTTIVLAGFFVFFYDIL